MVNNCKRATRKGHGPTPTQRNQQKTWAINPQPQSKATNGVVEGKATPVGMEHETINTTSTRNSPERPGQENNPISEEMGDEITLGELELEGLEAACAKEVSEPIPLQQVSLLGEAILK